VSVSPERRAELREQARRIVAGYGITQPPVPIDRIAKSRNIVLRYAPFDEELSGMAFIKDSLPVIAVNALHHPHRQRFTIAHELAHHVLHADELARGVHVDKIILRRDQLAATGTDDLEIEANTFASELLIPENMILPIVEQDIHLDDESRLLAIARRFKVSMAALQFRLAALD
jgi:Zn-dependent peptidase ImmA (M78 family)